MGMHCYVDDKGLADSLDIDRATLGLLKNQKGFPPKDPITKRWYWPAVVTWLDRRHQVGDPFFGVPDGKENFDALESLGRGRRLVEIGLKAKGRKAVNRERLDDNLNLLRDMQERLNAMLARVKADPELQGSSELIHVTGELTKSLGAEIQALERAIAEIERRHEGQG